MPRNSSRNYKTTKPIEYFPTKETRQVQTTNPNYNKGIPTQTQSQQPGFLSNVYQGFAWGTGTTIARNMFESKEHVVPSSLHKTEQIVPSSLHKTNENNCFQYKLCQKLNDPQECFNKMDVSEYTVCKKLLE